MSARSTFASSASASPSAASIPSRLPSFLAAVADDYEQALRETDRLRQDLMRMEAVLSRAPRAREEPAEHADDGAEAVRRHQGQRRTGSARASSARPKAGRSLLLEKTQARLEDIQREIDGLKTEAEGRRDVDRSEHRDAAQHAGVRPRAGSARARGQDPAPSSAPRRADRRRRARDAQSSSGDYLRRPRDPREPERQSSPGSEVRCSWFASPRRRWKAPPMTRSSNSSPLRSTSRAARCESSAANAAARNGSPSRAYHRPHSRAAHRRGRLQR